MTPGEESSRQRSSQYRGPQVVEYRNFQETAKSLCVWSSMDSTRVLGTESQVAGRGRERKYFGSYSK